MVRLQQCVRKTLSFVLVGVACQALQSIAQQYRPDDPIRKYRRSGLHKTPACRASMRSTISCTTPRNTRRLRRRRVLASILSGEVPDSSWFTNRPPLTIQELQKGARVHGGPQPPFTVVAAKTEGVTPGFRIKDGRGLTYFMKVDPPTNPEMATSADVMGALFLYAAGYNVPENYILARAPRRLPLVGEGDNYGAFGQEASDESFATREDSGCSAGRIGWPIRLMASLSVRAASLVLFATSSCAAMIRMT